ncbi:MAG TPA: cytochrome c [Gammaproteobacteria bacterium]|nr:cytochrome c [Gammaproteobacteria bacterium]
MDTAKTVIYTLIFVILAAVAGGLIFIYSGAFDVSARWEDGPLVKWAVVTTRERSIEVRKEGIKVPANLDDPKVVMAGFKHYREMCVECHRAPGLKGSETSKGLNPKPPNFGDLKEEDVDPAEFFWIIKNGIRMTAMPAWGVTHSDDKIWAMVAFLKKLPGMTPAQFKAMDEKAGPDTDHDETPGEAHEHEHSH